MSFELLRVISMLCLTPNGSDWGKATMIYPARAHLQCQQYYIKCIEKSLRKGDNSAATLSSCVLERKTR